MRWWEPAPCTRSLAAGSWPRSDGPEGSARGRGANTAAISGREKEDRREVAWKRIAVAAGVGYVFGAKAGRDRYEELADLWKKVSGSPAFERLSEEARHAYAWGREALGEAIERRASTGSDEGPQDADGGRDRARRA